MTGNSDETTENLNLPYIAAAQAQKHVTHNEAIRMLDALIQLTFKTMDQNSPPLSPVAGERHWVGSAPTGDWTVQEGKIAAWQDETWTFLEPQTGWLAYDQNQNRIVTFDGAAWVDAVVEPGELQNLSLLGLNTTANNDNRLSVASPSTLMTHEGAGHQLKINKNAESDTASVLFQTQWSGRAEFGLTGNDDWHVKVSPDGALWNDALIADRASGAIKLPGGIRHAESDATLRSQIFTPGGNNVSTIWRFDEQRTGFPRTATLDAVTGDVLTLVDGSQYANDPTTGTPIITGTGPVADKVFFGDVMEGLCYLRVWNTSKNPAQACWLMAAPSGNELRITDSAHISGWLPGETVQLGEPDLDSSQVVAVDLSQFLQLHTGSIFRQAGLTLSAGISAQGSGGWYGHIGASSDASEGSFSNVTSVASDHDSAFTAGTGTGGGLISSQILVGTTALSPISNSNLLFVREFDGAVGALRIGFLTALGIWV